MCSKFRLKLVIKSIQLFEKAICLGVLEFRFVGLTLLNNCQGWVVSFLCPSCPLQAANSDASRKDFVEQFGIAISPPWFALDFLPCGWRKGIKWFSATKSKVALNFVHTSWRGPGCESAYQCRAVPCGSILSGYCPGAGLVLGNESSDISSLLLEPGLPLVSRYSKIWCTSAPTSLCLSLCGSQQYLQSWRKKVPSSFCRLIFHQLATFQLVPETLSLLTS